MVRPFWEDFREHIEKTMEPETLQQGKRIVSKGNVAITSVKKGRVDIQVIGEDGKKYKVIQKRKTLYYDATNKFARKLAADKESYESVIQNKTPARITDLLIESDVFTSMRNHSIFIECSCGMIRSFCHHQAAAILQIIDEIPVSFPVCLAYFGIDQVYVMQTLRQEIGRRRKIQIGYDEFWYGDAAYHPERLEALEPEPPGVWYREAPAAVMPIVLDIEKARQRAGVEAAELRDRVKIPEKGQRSKGRKRKE